MLGDDVLKVSVATMETIFDDCIMIVVVVELLLYLRICVLLWIVYLFEMFYIFGFSLVELMIGEYYYLELNSGV